ncbi:MAG: hypothetical protein M1825_004915 [Sarcosagium campestre]|nr:MAG: hypothetical protein M1825_004915 [Sarcosagium campestre]
MPNEIKKRGRREQKKRKREGEDPSEDVSNKLIRLQENAENNNYEQVRADADDNFMPLADARYPDGTDPGTGFTFFGLLSEEEQQYFKHADDLLELNEFESVEDRNLFLNNVYRETDGKELKLACSQSCSRFIERLILLSTAEQTKYFFQKLSGQFLHLVQHRFASHCCETLFLRVAPLVTLELSAGKDNRREPDGGTHTRTYTAEDLVLSCLREFDGNYGFLLTDRFATHALRVLLTLLSGLPLATITAHSIKNAGSKAVFGLAELMDTSSESFAIAERGVPESFKTNLKLIISETIRPLSTTEIRALATHPTGNPVLQLLVELQAAKPSKFHTSDDSSVLLKLFPGDISEEDNGGLSFIKGIVFDPVGSRLLEAIVLNCPGKMFKMLIRDFFRERMGSLAKSDTATFVINRVLTRLNKSDLEEAISAIAPHLPVILLRSHSDVIKTLIERAVARGADLQQIVLSLKEHHFTDHGEGLLKLLKWKANPESGSRRSQPDATRKDTDQVHGSLLAQAMLSASTSLSELIQEGLLSLSQATILSFARNAATSRLLQAAFKLPSASVEFRRKLLNNFFDHIKSLASESSGSHVVDALWTGTRGLQHSRVRIAKELAAEEEELRMTRSGRAVWRNWNMDLYKVKRGDWIAKCKAEDLLFSHGGTTAEKDGAEKPMSGIELARAKYAASRGQKGGKGSV